MTRIRLSIMGWFVLAACMGAATARADTAAISFGGFGGGGFNYTQGSYLLGFQFQVKTAIDITQLGFYDAGSNGQAQTFQSVPVGVYDITTNTLLGSVTVTATDPLTGLFRYASLSNPIALNTTDTYGVVGISGTNYYTADVPASSGSVVINAPIEYLSPAYCGCNVSGFGQSYSLLEPGYFPTGSGYFSDFGANFQFTATIGAPNITAVSNAASGQAGVAGGTFASIYGTNFAAPGFSDTWSNSIVGDQLPTELDGVTVDIGGMPAYIVALLPGQINVLAPPLGTGSMPVTVTTPAGASSAFTVTMRSVQPAFFLWPGNFAVATHLNFSDAVKNGTFATATVPAEPGETIILWGTGFGATTPAAPTGQVVSGGPYVVQGVTVTIGGTPAQVSGVALASGLAGLYQVAVQVPASLANGDYAVIASLSGEQSPAGVMLTVQAAQ